MALLVQDPEKTHFICTREILVYLVLDFHHISKYTSRLSYLVSDSLKINFPLSVNIDNNATYALKNLTKN